MSEMKLWVVGKKSPNPDDWTIWTEYSLWVAETEERVRELSGCGQFEYVTEVDMTREVNVCTMPAAQEW